MNLPPSLLSEWREQWTRELAAPADEIKSNDASCLLVFRLGQEWFSVSASTVGEISPVPTLHRIPRRRARLVNVRGRVTVCVDLAEFLAPLRGPAAPEPRLIVLRHEEGSFAATVDALDGVHRVPAFSFAAPPAPPANRFTLDHWTLGERSVARINEPRLFRAIKESLA